MISDYIATYKYALFTDKTKKQQSKFIEKLITSKVAVFALDSTNCLYMGIDRKVTALPFKVNYRHGHFEAGIEFDNDFFDSLPEFFQVYIANSIGASIFERNLAPGNIENDYIILFLSSIILHIDGKMVFAYPTIKLYKSGVIIVDLAVYSSDREESERDIVDFLISLRTAQYERVQTAVYFLNYKGLDVTNVEIIERDGISRRYGDYVGDKISSFKDLSILLVSEIIDENQTFIAHHNFSLVSNKIKDNYIQALMNGIPCEATQTFKRIKYYNYREFEESYEHYVTVGTTITVGLVEETRIPSLVIDELFLYMAAKVFQLKSKLNSKGNSLDEILDLYKHIINIRAYLINGLSAYSFSKKIFDDLFRDYSMFEQMDNIKELIEVEVKSLEVISNKRQIKAQNIFALVLTLLSSEAIMTNIIRPFYLSYKSIGIEELTFAENLFMYILPLIAVLTILFIRHTVGKVFRFILTLR